MQSSSPASATFSQAPWPPEPPAAELSFTCSSLATPWVIVWSAGGSGSLAEIGHASFATFTLPAPEKLHLPPEAGTLVGEVVISASTPSPVRVHDLVAFILAPRLTGTSNARTMIARAAIV